MAKKKKTGKKNRKPNFPPNHPVWSMTAYDPAAEIAAKATAKAAKVAANMTKAPKTSGTTSGATSSLVSGHTPEEWEKIESKRMMKAIFDLDMGHYESAIRSLTAVPPEYRSDKAHVYLAEALCKHALSMPSEARTRIYQDAMDSLNRVDPKDRTDAAWVANMLLARTGLGEMAAAMKDAIAWRRAHLEQARRRDPVGVEMFEAAEQACIAQNMTQVEQTIYGTDLQLYRDRLQKAFGPGIKGPLLNYGQDDFFNVMWFSPSRPTRPFSVLISESTGPHGQYLPDGVYPARRMELVVALPSNADPFRNSNTALMWRTRITTLITQDYLALPPEKRIILPIGGDNDNGLMRYTRFAGFLLTEPTWLPPLHRVFSLKRCRREVNFLEVIPLLPEELVWVQTYGLEDILPRLQENHIAAERRKSVLTKAEKDLLDL